MKKKEARLRRARRARARIRAAGEVRLCVFRTSRHIYAQILAAAGDKVIASASSLEKKLRDRIAYGGNKDAAALIGKTVAERAKKAGVTRVAFDRSGYKYHGRVKALAEAAREQGMQF